MKETFFCHPLNTGHLTATIFYRQISSVEWETFMGQIETARVYMIGHNVAYVLKREDARVLWNELQVRNEERAEA